jgi:hypothetical protein
MRKSVPSNAAVMLRFTRVVALPDPKIVIFPAESILSYGWIAGYVETYGADKRREFCGRILKNFVILSSSFRDGHVQYVLSSER